MSRLKDGASRITRTATMNLMCLEYWYDDAGNVTRVLDYRNSSQYECYAYDTHGRLSEAFTGNSACTSYSSVGLAPFDHDYGYDNVHNLTSLDGPTYSYGSGNEAGSGDAGPHAVVAIGSNLSFGYDDNGNRITKTDDSVVTSYSYDSENRLVAVDLPGDSDDVVFVYDADGGRVSRSHGDFSTTYVGGVIEIDRDASTVTQTRSFYSFAGTPVAVRTHQNAATTFLFQNHLGSTVAAFDDTNNTAIKQYYYPYGAERHAVGSLPVDQRYTGQTSDATGADSGDTGMLYYQARYYDPDIGAFTAADTVVPTVGLSVGLNRYTYVYGSPTDNTDPSGNATIQMAAYATGDSIHSYQKFNPEQLPYFGWGGNPQAVFELWYAILNPGLDFGDVFEGTAVVVGTVVSSIAKGAWRLGGALLSEAGDLADVARECFRGAFGACAWEAGELAAEVGGGLAMGAAAMASCPLDPAYCVSAGAVASQIGIVMAGDWYRSFTAWLGRGLGIDPFPGGGRPATDPYAIIGGHSGLYQVTSFLGGGLGY